MKIVIYNDDGTVFQEIDKVKKILAHTKNEPSKELGTNSVIFYGDNEFLADSINFLAQLAFERVGSSKMIESMLKNLNAKNIIKKKMEWPGKEEDSKIIPINKYKN